MKKTLIIILCIIGGLGLLLGGCMAGCAIIGTSDTDTSVDTTTTTTTTVEEAENTSNEGLFDDYKVEGVGARMSKDYEDKDCVIITYNFTNYSSESAAFWSSFSDVVYQNGVGLNEVYVLKNNDADLDSNMKEVKDGATVLVEEAYELNDTVTDLEIEITDIFGLDGSYTVIIPFSEIK